MKCPSQQANSPCGTLPRCPFSSPSGFHSSYAPNPIPCNASDVLGALGLNFICNNIYITGKVSRRMEGREEWLLEVKLGASGEGKKKGNKRRFSDEEIRLLEMMFEEETKLEPKKKLQAARELGLQPRQVAIWFQNWRARWESKQLEREYNLLKANYDALTQSYDSLEKEKQSLLKQVKKLLERLEKPEKRSSEGSRDHDDGSGKAPTKSDKAEKKLKLSMGDGADLAFSACLVEENSISCIESFRPEESDMMPIVDPAGAESCSIMRPEDWADLDSGSFSDQSCCTMEWWDFWA